jgi:hypothetical protein
MPAPPKPRIAVRTSFVGTRTRSSIGTSIEESIDNIVIVNPGIVSYSFYSLTNASGQMLRPGAGSALSVVLPFRGSVVGLTFAASTACSGTYTVHLNGTASTALLTEIADTSDFKAWVDGTYGFVAGTTIDVRATSVTTSAIVEVIVYVLIDPNTTL